MEDVPLVLFEVFLSKAAPKPKISIIMDSLGCRTFAIFNTSTEEEQISSNRDRASFCSYVRPRMHRFSDQDCEITISLLLSVFVGVLKPTVFTCPNKSTVLKSFYNLTERKFEWI